MKTLNNTTKVTLNNNEVQIITRDNTNNSIELVLSSNEEIPSSILENNSIVISM